jgi:hypothetical protein
MSKLLLTKSWLIALGALAVASPVVAQQTTTTAIVTGPARPKADLNWAQKMFSDLRLEMGTVAKGTQVRKTLTVTNLYKEDITLAEVRTTCGCFQASTDKKVLKTHDVATVAVTMDTIRFKGKRDANLDVTLTFDNSTYKSVRIPLHGFIRTDVEIEPGVLNLSTVEQGRGVTKSIGVRFVGRPGAKITDVRANNPQLQVSAKPRFQDYSRSEFDVSVALNPSAPLGDVRDLLTIVTNDPANPELQVEVYGKVEPDLVVTPSAIPLGNLRPGVEKTFRVSIRGQRPFTIEKLERDSAVDCWKCKFSKESRSVHLVTLTMNPPDTPGDYIETFTITIPGRPEPVTIKATGTIIAAVSQDAENPLAEK